jgi:hypothetical protein
MKKRTVFTRLVAALLVLVMVGSMAACSMMLRGTYTNQDGLIKQSFTFKEDNKVEVSAFGIDVEGEYEIKNGEITITYSLLGLHYDWVKSFEMKGGSIIIDGTEFVKEK